MPQRLAHAAEAPLRAAAAHELDPLTALEPLPRRGRDDPDRARPRDVRAAARREVEAFDVDEAKRSLAERLLSQREIRRVLFGREPDGHRPIFPDDAVGLGLGRGDLDGAHLAREIDRRRLRAEMKAHRPDVEETIERRRQHVLAGMLLHVVEAPAPVDFAVHDVADRRRT